ncbi:MAG: hypothetical protein EBR30_26245 [Cytophagia bacterium]|nr:hypothetical protein [Cytophagia bacterium]
MTAVEGAVLVQGASDNSAALPAGADPDPKTVALLGLSLFAVTSTQTGADVVTAGIYPGVAAASISRGQLLTVANTAGGVKPANPAGGTNVATIGYAMEDASSGERVAIDIHIGNLQG